MGQDANHYSQTFNPVTIKKAKLLYASASHYNANWHSNLHTHYCSELFYVTEGEGHLQIGNETFPIMNGDLIIISPNVKHTEISDTAHPLSYLVIGIEDIELASIDEGEDIHFRILNTKDTKDSIRFYFQQIIDEYNHKSSESELMCKNLLENLLILLSRQIDFTVALTPIMKRSALLCIDIRQYIDNHFRENITLDLLAERAHVSKYHMVHVFTEEYGISPINYLILRRVEEGKKLLKTTDHSLSLISRTLGFSSPSYFSQVFKKHTGDTPMEYRQKSRK